MPSAEPPGSAARWRRSDRPEVAWRVSIPWSQSPGANLTVFCVRFMHRPTQPRCIVIAGPNGAGKTTFAREYLPKVAGLVQFVNADLIAQGLSPLDPPLAAISAGRLVLREINRLASERADFAFESTLSGLSYARQLNSWKSTGYRIEIVYLRLSSAQRAQDRADVRHADLRLGERKGRRQETVTGSRERRPALICRAQGSLSARGSLTSLTVLTLYRRVTIYFCESTLRRGGMYELEIRRLIRLSRNIGDHEAVSRSPVRLP